MGEEAEKYKAEDEAHRSKVEAKNGLENYCYNMKNTLNDDKMKDKVTPADKAKLESAIDEALQWLEANQMAEKDEFDAKQKEVEAIANPIMMKVYQSNGGGEGMPDMSGMGGGAGAGPSVEEVD